MRLVVLTIILTLAGSIGASAQQETYIFFPAAGVETTDISSALGTENVHKNPQGVSLLANLDKITLGLAGSKSPQTANMAVDLKVNPLPWLNFGGGFIELDLHNGGLNNSVKAPFLTAGVRVATTDRKFIVAANVLLAPWTKRGGTGLLAGDGKGWGLTGLVLWQFSKHFALAGSFNHLRVDSDLRPVGLALKFPEVIRRNSFGVGPVFRF